MRKFIYIERALLKTLVIVLITIYPSASNAQIFRNYTVEDGLPSNEVYEVFQDHEGYMWFATALGVSRFNGYEFENFNVNDGLPDNTIFGFFQDSQDRIWFRSYNGRLGHYYQNEFFVLNIPREYQKSHIIGITEPESGRFLVSYVGGETIEISVSKNGALVDVQRDASMPNPLVEIRLNAMQVENRKPRHNLKKIRKICGGVSVFNRFDSALVYIHRENLTVSTDLFRTYSTVKLDAPVRGNVFLSPKTGNVFVTTMTGYTVYEDLTFSNELSVNKTLKFASSLIEDNQGGLWVATTINGVYYTASSDVHRNC